MWPTSRNTPPSTASTSTTNGTSSRRTACARPGRSTCTQRKHAGAHSTSTSPSRPTPAPCSPSRTCCSAFPRTSSRRTSSGRPSPSRGPCPRSTTDLTCWCWPPTSPGSGAPTCPWRCRPSTRSPRSPTPPSAPSPSLPDWTSPCGGCWTARTVCATSSTAAATSAATCSTGPPSGTTAPVAPLGQPPISPITTPVSLTLPSAMLRSRAALPSSDPTGKKHRNWCSGLPAATRGGSSVEHCSLA